MFVERSYSFEQCKKIKIYTGILISLLVPFAVKSIMDMTKMPAAAAFIAWFICGITLRVIITKSNPYFHPKTKNVPIETFILTAGFVLSGYILFRGIDFNPGEIAINKNILINIVLFAILNGIFEQLILTNIFDLAGCDYKIFGIFFSAVYAVLINYTFYSKILPVTIEKDYLFYISEAIVMIVPLIMYSKTKDITIWTLLKIIYNILIILFYGFGYSTFLYIK